jgi:hypothetical protein
MTDSYQAVYDAVRSRISNGNVGDVIREVAFQQFDISWAKEIIQQEFTNAAQQMARPCALYRPSISIDGNMWCALYGDNLQDGIAGFGDSVALAMEDFDRNWFAKLSERPVKCAACNGTGSIDAPTSADDPGCRECGGQGWVQP